MRKVYYNEAYDLIGEAEEGSSIVCVGETYRALTDAWIEIGEL